MDRVGGADAAGHLRKSRPDCVYRGIIGSGSETYQSGEQSIGQGSRVRVCARGSVVQAISVSIQFFGWVAWGSY